MAHHAPDAAGRKSDVAGAAKSRVDLRMPPLCGPKYMNWICCLDATNALVMCQKHTFTDVIQTVDKTAVKILYQLKCNLWHNLCIE